MIDNCSGKSKIQPNSHAESKLDIFKDFQKLIMSENLAGPQRVRGTAGTGKTLFLAMKAANAYFTNPRQKILVTFYTRSLEGTLKELITRILRDMYRKEPNWAQIHVRHGWGGRRRMGVYSDACGRHKIPTVSYNEAKKNGEDPLECVCRELLQKANIDAYYELTLIDQAQDFPKSFLELVFRLTKGERKKKNIIWAYDEMQITSKPSAPWTAELFGLDLDAQAQADFKRAELRFSGGHTNDIVLRKSYRTQRRVLVTAHALGFGLYNNIVQLPSDEEYWNDLGYKIISGEIKAGHEVKLFRPTRNSAPSINGENIFEIKIFPEILEEIKWAGSEIKKFIGIGIEPHDILVVSLDDKQARSYLLALAHELAFKGIVANNIIFQRYREPPFSVADNVTLSTVYRAKGHEASVVLILGLDAIDNRRRYERNKLYVAITRSKAWVRVSGVGSKADVLRKEIEVAWQKSPMLEFVVPGSQKFNRIKMRSHKGAWSKTSQAE